LESVGQGPHHWGGAGEKVKGAKKKNNSMGDWGRYTQFGGSSGIRAKKERTIRGGTNRKKVLPRGTKSLEDVSSDPTGWGT